MSPIIIIGGTVAVFIVLLIRASEVVSDNNQQMSGTGPTGESFNVSSETGPTGPTGPSLPGLLTIETGDTGPIGVQGPVGPTGISIFGETGPTGFPGPFGPIGNFTGDTGQTGTPGFLTTTLAAFGEYALVISSVPPGYTSGVSVGDGLFIYFTNQIKQFRVISYVWNPLFSSVNSGAIRFSVSNLANTIARAGLSIILGRCVWITLPGPDYVLSASQQPDGFFYFIFTHPSGITLPLRANMFDPRARTIITFSLNGF